MGPESDSGDWTCDYIMTGVKEDTLGAYGTSGGIWKIIAQNHVAVGRSGRRILFKATFQCLRDNGRRTAFGGVS